MLHMDKNTIEHGQTRQCNFSSQLSIQAMLDRALKLKAMIRRGARQRMLQLRKF